MNINELIAQLEDAKNDYGNLEVYSASDTEGNSVTDVEEAAIWFNDDDDPVALVIWPGWTELDH